MFLELVSTLIYIPTKLTKSAWFSPPRE